MVFAAAYSAYHPGDQYCCGNKKIAHQLRHYVKHEREEKAKREGAAMPVQVNFIASAGIAFSSHFFSIFRRLFFNLLLAGPDAGSV